MKNTVSITDWEHGSPATLEVWDQGDSVSLVVKLTHNHAYLEIGVRLNGDRLDQLDAEIRRIRELRGI